MNKIGVLIFILILGCTTSPTTYQLSTNVVPEEGGSIDKTPDQDFFDPGEEVIIDAKPINGWKFVEWSDGISSERTPYSITMNSDLSVSAIFEKREYPLNLITEGNGNVKETLIRSKNDYKFGSVVQLEAIPFEGWEFAEWSGDIEGNENPREITISDSMDIKATFQQSYPTLSLSIVGDGSISVFVQDTIEIISDSSSLKMRLVAEKDYLYNSEIRLIARAGDPEFYSLNRWEGDIESENDTLIFVIKDDTDLTAYFDFKVSNDELAQSLFRKWYNGIHNYSSFAISSNVLADQTTCSWGNFWMRSAGSEPRMEFDLTGQYASITQYTHDHLYSLYRYSDYILDQIDEGYKFENDAHAIKAIALFSKFLATGYTSLIFDQGFITEQPIGADYSGVIPKTSSEILTLSLDYFEELIAHTSNNSFNISNTFINTPLDLNNIEFAELAYAFATRLLVNYPRNKEQRDDLDWTMVLNYANNSRNRDFNIELDIWEIGGWYNEHYIYSTYPGWARADMRVINMMDDSYPAHNPNGYDFPAPDSTRIFDNINVDDRLWSDFTYLASNNFRPERGLYYFSSFRYTRHVDYIGTWSSMIPEIRATEIQMYQAEALAKTGNLAAAAAILNDPAGARKVRGGLPDVAIDASAIEAAIHHERLVELFLTGAGLSWFEMRGKDLLQNASILELPLPLEIQNKLGIPNYTFGGPNNPGAETDGWRSE